MVSGAGRPRLGRRAPAGRRARAVVVALLLVWLVAPTSVGSQPTTPNLTARCTAQPPEKAWDARQSDTVRTAAQCMLRAVRRARHLPMRTDKYLRVAAEDGLDLGVKLASEADPVARVSHFLDRRMRGRCRRPSRVRFSANDTGPNGTIRTPAELATWIRRSATAQTVSHTIPRFIEPRVRIAVVAREGRFGEHVTAGAVALLIAGLRCD